LAAKDLSDATKALKRAKRAYNKQKALIAQYQKDYKAGKISKEDLDEAKDDLKYYQANLALAIKNQASAAKSAATATSNLSASSLTAGFSAGLTIDR